MSRQTPNPTIVVVKHKAKSTITIIIISFQRHQKYAREDKATPKPKNVGKDARTTTLLYRSPIGAWVALEFSVAAELSMSYDPTKNYF
jgi:hypothetical protein